MMTGEGILMFLGFHPVTRSGISEQNLLFLSLLKARCSDRATSLSPFSILSIVSIIKPLKQKYREVLSSLPLQLAQRLHQLPKLLRFLMVYIPLQLSHVGLKTSQFLQPLFEAVAFFSQFLIICQDLIRHGGELLNSSGQFIDLFGIQLNLFALLF